MRRSPLSSRSLSLVLAATAFVPITVGVGFASQASWATSMWPFEVGRLSAFFLAAILIALAVPTLWVSATQEWGALRAGALFPALTFTAMTIHLIEQQASADHSGLVPFAVATALAAAYSVALILLGRGVPLRDQRPLPGLVRASFAAFAGVLLASGAALVAGAQDVIPWPADEGSLVMFGFIFLGAASSYAWATLRPVWGYAYAPLLGFLAYDLVLLPPLVGHLSDVAPEQRMSLVIYVAVLAYSGSLASYYLLIRRETRLWASRDARG